MSNNKVSEEAYQYAVDVIRQYKTQIDEERKQSFLDSLSEYDQTYWLQKGRLSTVYLSCVKGNYGYNVNKFIVNTNGIIEIRSDNKRKEDLEYYLAEMGEYAPDEYELQDGKKNFRFEQMTHDQFMWDVSRILDKMNISTSAKIMITKVNTPVNISQRSLT